MEDDRYSSNQSNGHELPIPTSHRKQSPQAPQAEVQSIVKELPTSLSKSDHRHKAPSDAKQAKLLASIEQLRSNISTTEARLSTKLREITQLKSYSTSASTANENKQGFNRGSSSSSQQVSVPEIFQQQHDSTTIPASMSVEDEKAALAHAHSIINKHISLLKTYNGIKDVAMEMLGLIAEKEGRRLKDVMDERGIDERD
ncbi:hypothetical protein Z517_11033 [Fonsecaea pedrosoi CBS 271.37]|uniref:Swi5-domain-containing protein n=1 Tax=Fonsecaea pedrosoi CBS 271.37 TaxID=1442368 RepID=A0A0D2EPI6_9EURO|nr:uncharacterized protein Z517_11033 [Fonsecaea pedrosoi CBS 271.37]KIW76287.1 hypothetical protein Z517_11033 [Fonsecaea pedrosoi CBS 271.37]